MDGKNTKSNPSTYSVTSSISLKNPSRKGYSFKGWYSDSKYKNKVTSIKKRTGNLTLYAKWSATSYRITYKLNGGKNTKSNPSAFTINSTVSLKNPSRKGYSFKAGTVTAAIGHGSRQSKKEQPETKHCMRNGAKTATVSRIS